MVLIIAACGNKGGDKKSQLEQLKKDREKITAEITKLEAELKVNDSTAKVSLVTVAAAELGRFRSFIDIQGKIDADQNVSVSPEMPGVITNIRVQVGQNVSKGQVLADLDHSLVQKGIVELQGSLDLVTTLFQKQKALWDQGIGTEVQFLQAKNNKESLENKMASLKEQLEKTYIKAPISGIVDAMELKVGQAVAPGIPGLRVLNNSKLKVKGEVAESYSSYVGPGKTVIVNMPDANDSLTTRLGYVAKYINPISRTFSIEIPLASKAAYKPNMLAIIKIVDYENPKVITVPVKVVQKAESGDFVFISKNNKATKARVKLGRTYNGTSEILEGLAVGDEVITTGFEELNEGDPIKF